MTEMSEVDLIQEGHNLDVFAVFGDDPYTIPIILTTKAWTRKTPPEERRAGRAKTHLWKYVTEVYEEIRNGHRPCDNKYRRIMDKLVERGLAKRIIIHDGMRRKFDYELTEYGEAVCEKHKDSLREQIKLEKWRRRAQKMKL